MCEFIILAQYLLMASRSLIWPWRKETWASRSSSCWFHTHTHNDQKIIKSKGTPQWKDLWVWCYERRKWKRDKRTTRKQERRLVQTTYKQITTSFLPMVLLWERERVILKKDSFLVADSGGDEVLTSLPLDSGRGGDAVDWARPPERLSMLGEELTVQELWPKRITDEWS